MTITATERAAAFLLYWRNYRDDVDDIAACARHIAHRDGRAVVCQNDVEAAWTRIVGPLAVHGG